MYDSNYMTFWKRQKRKEAVERSLVTGGEEEGREDEKSVAVSSYLTRQRVPQYPLPLLSS